MGSTFLVIYYFRPSPYKYYNEHLFAYAEDKSELWFANP